MSESIRTEFTPNSPGGGGYRDLGIKIFDVFITLLILAFIITDKAISQTHEGQSETIKIGLLIQDSSCISAIQGAEMAIRIANRNGGLNGRNFQLIVRSMEGPWGTGSKEAVSLIFEEKVWALFGLHDGRNAHLVEQAATKSIVVFVSAWTGDPTLSQAFVPWFFNCVPNDNQQAASLFEEIYNKRKFKKVVIVSDNDYDSKSLLNTFLKAVKKSGKPEPPQFSYDDYPGNPQALTDEIIKADANCILLLCEAASGVKIAREIRQKKINKLLFGSLRILNEDDLSLQDLQVYDNILSIPSGDWPGLQNQTFRVNFQKFYKRMPGMVASYSYDGMSVLIKAVRTAGSNDREMMQKSLENIHFNGVTGTVQFDEKGNRSGTFETREVKDGLPALSADRQASYH